jgi:SAM-dependent methyltransferase
VLTVDYDRLGLRRGESLLDLGCGAGRHAFQAMRLGANVVALDSDGAEVKDASALMGSLEETDEATIQSGGRGKALTADARALPFPDAAFDRVIASEVLEHIPEDRRALAELSRVLRPGGTIAITVPRWWPELVCWALSDDYHGAPGGHCRIYRHSALTERARDAGLRPFASHHAHALHSPYWWLRCAVGVDDDRHVMVRAYHRVLVWDITAGTPVTRVPERVLNPVLGKSLVLYMRKERRDT